MPPSFRPMRAIRTQGGASAAGRFGDRNLHACCFASQVVLLALALIFTPQVIELLAPGFFARAAAIHARVSLTRITFPYLLLITLVTLWSGILNASQPLRGGGGGADPAQCRDDGDTGARLVVPGRRLCGGVGRADLGRAAGRAGRRRHAAQRRYDLVPGAALGRRRAAFFSRRSCRRPIGSAGTQLALFADTIIASFLSAGAISALYYADRSTSSRSASSALRRHRAGAGDDEPACIRPITTAPAWRKNRAIEFALVLAIPCAVAFLVVPELIMRALFMRGAFTAARCACGGDDADGLHHRPCSVRSHPQRRRAVSRPRRHCNAGQGGTDRTAVNIV